MRDQTVARGLESIARVVFLLAVALQLGMVVLGVATAATEPPTDYYAFCSLAPTFGVLLAVLNIAGARSLVTNRSLRVALYGFTTAATLLYATMISLALAS